VLLGGGGGERGGIRWNSLRGECYTPQGGGGGSIEVTSLGKSIAPK